jgi:lipoprotein-releasing system ATP-binding protein
LALLEAINIQKSFIQGDRVIDVLRGIDATFERGEMAAIVGPSGVGKTTLLHILGTLDTPTRGTVLFENEDLTKKTEEELAVFRNKHIGFVFQFHHLLPEFTALENTCMPCLIRRMHFDEARAKAEKVLTDVGLSHRMEHRTGEMSGGEQQRVALARALVLEPVLLLADEPTGNLDTKTGEEVQDIIINLNATRNLTSLIVTHNEKFASRMGRRITFRDGLMVQESGI